MLSLFLAVATSLPAVASDIVVTATRTEQDVRTTGQTITIIDRTTIDTRQTPVLADLLATTPGVTVARTGGPGSLTSVRIRGGEAAQTLVLIDGVRVNDPSDPSGAYDFGALLSDTIDRVEVLRGPNSVAWGSQALAGIVSVTTAPPSGEIRIGGSAEYGEDDTRRASSTLDLVAGPIRARLGGQYFKTEGVSALQIGSERDGFRQYGANGRLDIPLGSDIAIDLRGYWTRNRVEYDDAFTPADSGDVARTRQLVGYAGVNAAVADGALHNRIAYTVSDIDRRYASDFPFTARGRGERIEYVGDARLASTIRVVFGAESEWSRYRTFDDFSGVDRRRTRIWSGYGQVLLTPLGGVTLTGGVRHDQHRQFGGKTTMGANVAWASGNTTLRASYAEGFKAPTLSQLYGFGGDPGLRPETARSIDGGVEQRLINRRLYARVTMFSRRSRNLIVSDPATFHLSNIARAKARGVEFEVEARPVAALALTANYTHLRSTDRTSGSANFGNDLRYRPRDSASASLDWQSGRIGLGGTIRLSGDSYDDAANQHQIDGYVLADIRGEIALGERLRLYGRVENLFDARYETVAGYGTLGRNAHVGVRVTL